MIVVAVSALISTIIAVAGPWLVLPDPNPAQTIWDLNKIFSTMYDAAPNVEAFKDAHIRFQVICAFSVLAVIFAVFATLSAAGQAFTKIGHAKVGSVLNYALVALCSIIAFAVFADNGMSDFDQVKYGAGFAFQIIAAILGCVGVALSCCVQGSGSKQGEYGAGGKV